MSRTRVHELSCALLLALALTACISAPLHAQTTSRPAAQTEPGAAPPPPPALGAANVLQTTVRRVVLDVVVTDRKGDPAPGLTASDFTVTEDGVPQRILSFDASGFSPVMDYTPPALPPQPPGTYIDLPTSPEKGPLYVLLYDMVNIESTDQEGLPGEHSTQPFAREQMLKFIESKPDGARFAIFVRSDGLHLVQGFTSNKALLEKVLDPHHPSPHFPAIFLGADNWGHSDPLSALSMLHTIALFLDGLPGRKNLIWFSSTFPLQLFAPQSDGPTFEEESKQTVELLARDQIAIYPVYATGVPLGESHAMLSTSAHSDTLSSTGDSSQMGVGNGSTGGGSSPVANSTSVQGTSTTMANYDVMDELARETGGRAFYGTNDVARELSEATRTGAVFYTLTYSPSNKDYDGKERNIRVTLDRTGDQLAYRHSYFATATPPDNVMAADTVLPGADASPATAPTITDSLAAEMQDGAPLAHRLVFIVKADDVGAPAMGTPQEMASLATEPAYFKSRHRSRVAQIPPPVMLQKITCSFFIPTRQFSDEPAPQLEVAAAAYDANDRMMNGVISESGTMAPANGAATPRFYRLEQSIEVPEGATTLRIAVRDTANDRIGAMQIALPLPQQDAAKR